MAVEAWNRRAPAPQGAAPGACTEEARKWATVLRHVAGSKPDLEMIPTNVATYRTLADLLEAPAAPVQGGVEARKQAHKVLSDVLQDQYDSPAEDADQVASDMLDCLRDHDLEVRTTPAQGAPHEGEGLDLEALELFVSRAMSEDDWSFDVVKEGKKCLEMFARLRAGRAS